MHKWWFAGLMLGMLGLSVLPVVAGGRMVTFYVAPQGQDSWSGRLAGPNRGRTDGPFAGLARAQQAVRAQRAADPTTPVEVQVRGGRYALAEPLTFTPADGGTATAPVVYRAYPGEAPVLSGGVRLTGWQPGTVNGHPCWVTTLPQGQAGGWAFTQLFVNGQRAPRPRLPKEGCFRFAKLPEHPSGLGWDNNGPLTADFTPGDLHAWPHLRDVEIVVLQHWVDKHLHPATVDEVAHTVTFVARGSNLQDENDQPSRYYVENVLAALDTPGQWYLDRQAGTCYYLPRPGETPERTEIIAPRLATLLRFAGSAAQPVAHLTLEGLSFAHAEWTYPATNPGDAQAASTAPAAVQFTGADHCALFRCAVAHVGQYAVEIGTGCTGTRLIACALHDLGAGGVKITTGSARSEVADCTIRDGGRVYHQAVGVLIGDSGYNHVHHNEIAAFDYTGISCGWSWGYGKTATIDNRLEYNHIHDLGRGLLSDMGGIYTLGVQPGGIIRGNVIHDITKYGYGGWGIYNDEGSSGMLVEGNLTYRTGSCGYNMHYGRDELVRNNIFAFAGEANIGRGRQEAHRSFVFAHNIVLWAGKQEMFQGYANAPTWPHMAFAQNLYWNTAGTGVDFAGFSLPEWQALGNDRESRVADPQFRNPQAGDFRLRRSSPAWQLGVAPLDPALAGPRHGTAARLSAWPATPDPAVPIVESRLEALPGGFTPERNTGTVRLTVTNLGTAPARGQLIVQPEVEGTIHLPDDRVLPFTLAPGETAQRDFAVEVLSQDEEVALVTRPAGDAVIPTCLYLPNPASRQWTIPRLAALATPEEIPAALQTAPARPVRWLAQTVAAVQLAIAGDQLALYARVYDPMVTQVPDHHWEGSSLGLYCALPDKKEIAQLTFLPPDATHSALLKAYHNGQPSPVPPCTYRVRTVPGGYEVLALVPLHTLALPADPTTFAVETLVNLTPANSTQHRTLTLFGSLQAAVNHERYGVVTVQ